MTDQEPSIHDIEELANRHEHPDHPGYDIGRRWWHWVNPPRVIDLADDEPPFDPDMRRD